MRVFMKFKAEEHIIFIVFFLSLMYANFRGGFTEEKSPQALISAFYPFEAKKFTNYWRQ